MQNTCFLGVCFSSDLFLCYGVAVFGAVIQTDSWITFKEEVVWLGGLAGHLTFRNEFSHM